MQKVDESVSNMGPGYAPLVRGPIPIASSKLRWAWRSRITDGSTDKVGQELVSYPQRKTVTWQDTLPPDMRTL